MQLAITQLAQHLTQALKPLYVFTGDEPLSQREALDALRAAARAQGYEERQSLVVERSFNWQQLASYGQSASLFSTLRLLELRIPSGKPGAEGSKALQQLAAAPPQEVCVIVLLPRLDKDARNSSWYAALQQAAVCVQLQEVSLAALPQWIAERLAAQQQQADGDTLQFLAQQVEGNLLAAHQEIQKLGLLFPAGRLDAEAVRAAVLNVSRYDTFQLGDAVLLGDAERTVRILRGLQEEGAQAVPVSRLLTDWVIRPLLKLKEAEAQGESANAAMQKAYIRFDKQDLFRRAGSRLSLRQLRAALSRLAEIDQLSKGIGSADAWLEISRLCSGLAQVGLRSAGSSRTERRTR
ncbi:DNA polymerase III subunit delta [Pseudomethylobacillus aquaticus]|uniref:DNA polymerase III subunit delta n=1 Tax=Pseudomethylobacillus aquaticus TaxID=2676064 RepID=A0A3N0V3E8_9PROT|nr:DNA polymerase III subunit delta [Pseudomethylobacillus aquaticus]ROH87253.1 DNA polymerase III subunit delta [Pseudomethylobacillus aquaticus]